MKSKFLLTIITISLLCGCCRRAEENQKSNVPAAKDYFIGIYTGDPSVVQELASDDIRVSYPLFENLFGSTVIQGREAVEGFAERFSRKWGDPEIEIKKTIEEGDSVVLIWNFKAFDLFADPAAPELPREKISWGGITYLQFDAEGKIVMEIGEESVPGPFGRLAAAD